MSGHPLSRRPWQALLFPALGLAALAAPAQADLFGPISIASVGSLGGPALQQVEYAHDAAISGDGRYVAFDGSVGGVTGVWRRDLTTGAIKSVALGDAALPSLSETGRYVSFTSTQSLVPGDGARGPNVWRRDMEPGADEPEYVLVSAVNGSEQAISFEYPNPALEEPRFGAVAAGRSAISADGNEVAFVTTAASNLTGGYTPALQVAVRTIDDRETLLVSGAYEPASGRTLAATPVSGEGGAYGAVYPGSAKSLGFTQPAVDGNWEANPPPGASISADGSTVTWMGEDISKQVPMLPGENTPPIYTEPLWRRIEAGSSTPTERVTGGSDPAAPGCAASGETALPEIARQTAADPCQGPFEVGFNAGPGGSRGIWSETGGGGQGNFVPRLSADGYTVAFLSSALPVGFGPGFANEPEGEPADIYLANMHPGLTRTGALLALTEVGGSNVAASSPVTDFEISGNGEQVAFTTRRTQFALGSPAYITPVLAEPGESELYDVDLHNLTVTRVTRGYGGEPAEQTHGSLLNCREYEDPYCNPITLGAQSPSLSEDGRLIAFSSTSSNLVYGDGNGPRNRFGSVEGRLDGSDAFVVERQPFVSLPTPEYISPAPQKSIVPDWRIGASALSRRDGSVAVYVAVPGAGRLDATARSRIVVHKRLKGRRSSRVRATVTVASGSERIGAEDGGIVLLVLRPAVRYARLVAPGGRLSSQLSVTFTAPGHPELRESLVVSFASAITATGHGARRRAPARRRGARP